MRVSFEGDTRECQRWIGKAQQELFRLQQRMSTQGQTQGSFHKILAPGVTCIGYILPSGMQTVHVSAVPLGPPLTAEEKTRRSEHVFEFFTSGKPATVVTVTQDDVTWNAYEYAAIEVGVSIGGDASNRHLVLKPRTRGRQPPTERSRWTNRLPQIQMLDEPVAYTASGAILYESYAPITPYSGIVERVFNNGHNLLAYEAPAEPRWGRGTEAYDTRDFGIDIPFEYSPPNVPASKDAYITTDADWPRMNAIQTATHTTWGLRRFGIMGDAYSQFHIFPLSAIGPTSGYAQNVDPATVTMLRPTFPAWAYVGADKIKDIFDAVGIAKSFLEAPELDWKFNHLGTKAVAVVVERDLNEFDTPYFGTDVGADPYLAEYMTVYQQNDTGISSRHGALETDWDTYPDTYTVGPGLIGVEIIITLTGPNPEDYTATIELTEIRRPRETPYCTLLAGYCWHDVLSANGVDYAARAGDLCTLDIERWYNATTVSVNSFMTLKNLVRDVGEDVIRTFHAQGVVAVDFHTLSFALREVHDTSSVVTYDKLRPATGTLDVGTIVRHFGISIWIKNRLMDVMFPDSMDPAIKNVILAASRIDPRDLLVPPEQWALLPLNDLRDWTDAELNKLRYKWASDASIQDPQSLDPSVKHRHKSAGVNPGAPSVDSVNWLNVAVKAYNDARYLIYINRPCFGWYMYADETMNRMWVSPATTFFTHPNGMWAFYCAEFIYNRYGVSTPIQSVDSLGPFDVSYLEHCIFDKVHFVAKDTLGAHTKNTTFVELYNAAIATDPTGLEMTAITRGDLRLIFVKDTGVWQISPGFHTFRILDLNLTMNGRTWYYLDTYLGQAPDPVGGEFALTGGGGLVDLTLGSAFNDEAFGIRTSYLFPGTSIWGTAVRTHFSSCVMT